MTPTTLLWFLMGGREAIETVARSRWSLPIGLLFVFSGSLARNYDGADLLGNPAVLLHGVGVSVANAILLLSLVYIAATLRSGVGGPWLRGFVAFLGCFWMTAPMAWLYGVPYELLLTPGGAIKANSVTLALVSVWRVALITRVLCVLHAARFVPMLLLVLLFAVAAVLLGFWLSPQPLLDFMGGFRALTPEEHAVRSMNSSVLFFTIVLAGPLALAALIGLRWLNAQWSLPDGPVARPSPTLVALALASVAGWGVAAMAMQGDQRRAAVVQALAAEGDWDDVVAELSRHAREDYPARWTPITGAALSVPRALAELMNAAENGRPGAWVVPFLVRNSREMLLDALLAGEGPDTPDLWLRRLDGDDLRAVARVVRFHLAHEGDDDAARLLELEKLIERIEQESKEAPASSP